MPVLHVYCDESGTAERYMLYGGVITLEKNAQALDGIINQWRLDSGMVRELKWSKVSKFKLPEYRSFVDVFFEHARQGYVHFNVVVFDTREIDYKRYHRGDKTLGFYRFYYKFLLHKFGVYAHDDGHLVRVFLDQRSELNGTRLDTMRIILNRGIRKRYSLAADVVTSVDAKRSHESNLMQMADVLMGAVGFHCNDLHKRKGSSPAKRALAEHIAKQARVRLLSLGTNPRRPDFGIWRFKFDAQKQPRQLAPRGSESR